MVALFAYRDKATGAARMYGGFRERIEADAEPGSIKEMDRLPIPREEILDPVTLTIIPDPDKARREKLAALSATDAGVIRGVDDLCKLLVSKGVLKPEDVPADLQAKLDEREALRAQLTAEIRE